MLSPGATAPLRAISWFALIEFKEVWSENWQC